MPPAEDTVQVFVGREQLLVQILCGLAHGTSLRAHDVSGPYGIGKSSLLRQAQRRSEEGELFATVIVDLAEHDPGYAGQVGDRLTLGEAGRNVDELKHLGASIVMQLDPDAAPRFDSAAEEAIRPAKEIKVGDVNVRVQVSVASSATVSDSPTHANVTYDPQSALAAATRQAGMALADLIIGFINDASRVRPLLLLVDDVDRVTHQEIGVWLLRVLRGIERAVVVLTHEPGSTLSLPEGLATPMRISPLTSAEVSAYLLRRSGDQPTEELVDLVTRFTGGLPIAVDLLVKLMEDETAGLRASDLQSPVSRLPEDPASRLANLVTSIVDRIEDKPLGKALRAASIPLECDAELFGVLLAKLEITPDHAPKLMHELEAFSFTDQYVSGSDHTYYVAVHPFLRHGLARRMEKYEPKVSGQLHALAARHHFDEFVHSKSYDEMFGYEQPEQQTRLRKWLYHQAHSDDWRATTRQSAFVFLDAFWWWGNYVQFDFCEILALDFGVVAEETGDAKLRQFAGAVHRFVEAYPYRAKLRQDFDHRYPSAPWDEVRDALLEIQELCQVVDLGPDPTEEELHLAALLEIFLAHSHRYQSRSGSAEAARCYERAAAMFGELEEWSDLPWVVFERADLALDSGDSTAARVGAEEAARILYQHIDNKNPDEELIANLHRLHADRLWQEGDVDRAAREYGVAVAHSYLFHAIGGPPDDYTMQFYFEMRGRAGDKLLRLWAEGQRDAAVRAAGLMLESLPRGAAWPPPSPDELREVFESGTVFELAHALFPRGPDLGELGQASSPFMKELRRIRNALGGDLRRDLPVGASSPIDL